MRWSFGICLAPSAAQVEQEQASRPCDSKQAPAQELGLFTAACDWKGREIRRRKAGKAR